MSLTEMENKYFPLEAKENSRLVRIVQLVLGVLCIAIAIFWIVYNVKSLRSDNKLWASIAFLV